VPGGLPCQRTIGVVEAFTAAAYPSGSATLVTWTYARILE